MTGAPASPSRWPRSPPALAIISAGTALAPIPHVPSGEHALAATMAGLGVGALADPCVSIRRLRQWALFIAMFVGGVAALVVSFVAGDLLTGPAALLGLLAAAISHAGPDGVLAPLPATAMPRAQLAAAATSSLLIGVVAYAVVSSPWFTPLHPLVACWWSRFAGLDGLVTTREQQVAE